MYRVKLEALSSSPACSSCRHASCTGLCLGEQSSAITCNQVQSSAIKCNQVQSSAITCTGLCLGEQSSAMMMAPSLAAESAAFMSSSVPCV